MIDADGAHAMHLLDPAKDGEVQRLIDVSGAPCRLGRDDRARQGSDGADRADAVSSPRCEGLNRRERGGVPVGR